jgi:hypothetical protein
LFWVHIVKFSNCLCDLFIFGSRTPTAILRYPQATIVCHGATIFPPSPLTGE